MVALDGAFFNASASDASVLTKAQLEKELKQLELDIDAYCQGLDAQDAQESGRAPADSSETRFSRTDPDARALRKAGQPTVGYNLKGTVDAKHKLIVHYEVTNDGNDTEQLARQAMGAQEVLGVDHLIAVADAGFYSEAQLAECAAANITAYVAIPDKSRAVRAEERFSGAQFRYLPQVDV